MKTIPLSAWLLAIRPKTLIATVAPMAVGASLAFRDGDVFIQNLLIAFLAALLIQIATNLSNDYFDFRKGADTKERVGPVRVTQSGLISANAVRRGFLFCLFVAAMLGAVLVYETGLALFWVGLASLICAVAYTAGPWPIAYIGLGELFVLVFFGPVAAGFTYYVASTEYSALAFLLGTIPGLMSCGILIANNLRDVDQDKRANKRTLAVRFGRTFAKFEYCFMWICAYSILIAVSYLEQNAKLLIPVIILPWVVRLCIRVAYNDNPRELIAVLEGTAKLLALFTVLSCISLFV